MANRNINANHSFRLFSMARVFLAPTGHTHTHAHAVCAISQPSNIRTFEHCSIITLRAQSFIREKRPKLFFMATAPKPQLQPKIENRKQHLSAQDQFVCSSRTGLITFIIERISLATINSRVMLFMTKNRRPSNFEQFAEQRAASQSFELAEMNAFRTQPTRRTQPVANVTSE